MTLAFSYLSDGCLGVTAVGTRMVSVSLKQGFSLVHTAATQAQTQIPKSWETRALEQLLMCTWESTEKRRQALAAGEGMLREMTL